MLGLFIVLSSAPGWGLFHSGNPVRVFSIQEFFLIPLFRASCSCFEHTVLVLCVGEKPLAGENLWSSQASGVRSCCGSVPGSSERPLSGGAHTFTHTCAHILMYMDTGMHAHACTHKHVHAHTCTHKHVHTINNTHSPMHKHSCNAHVHICTFT